MSKSPTTRVSRAESRRRLAANLPRLMAERGISPGELAKRAGVCRRVLNRAMVGKTDPALSLALSVAGTLGISTDELGKPISPPAKKSRKRS